VHSSAHPEQGNTYVLLWIDKHDDAYQWAVAEPVTSTASPVLAGGGCDSRNGRWAKQNAWQSSPASLPSL